MSHGYTYTFQPHSYTYTFNGSSSVTVSGPGSPGMPVSLISGTTINKYLNINDLNLFSSPYHIGVNGFINQMQNLPDVGPSATLMTAITDLRNAAYGPDAASPTQAKQDLSEASAVQKLLVGIVQSGL